MKQIRRERMSRRRIFCESISTAVVLLCLLLLNRPLMGSESVAVAAGSGSLPPVGQGEEGEPRVPEPSVPEPEVPEPSVPEPEVPEPSVPEPEVPEPSVPEPESPQPGIPEGTMHRSRCFIDYSLFIMPHFI